MHQDDAFVVARVVLLNSIIDLLGQDEPGHDVGEYHAIGIKFRENRFALRVI